MPVSCQIPIRNISKAEFDERDRVVMRSAYGSQNHLGRLCDESVYENDMVTRIKAAGLQDVYSQVPVTIVIGDFKKTYKLDLVVDNAIYELKTAAALTGDHDNQALNYAMFCNVSHAKLVNFRTPRVQGKLKYVPLTLEGRRKISYDYSAWKAMSPQCDGLKKKTVDVLHDLGAFLDTRLYEEVLVHMCGGAERSVLRVPVSRDGIVLGSHLFQSHAEGIGFIVTALTNGSEQYHRHISSLLRMTSLKAMQWINLCHASVQFVTVTNPNPLIRLTQFG